jgi:hypothetical protein
MDVFGPGGGGGKSSGSSVSMMGACARGSFGPGPGTLTILGGSWVGASGMRTERE